MAKVRRWKETCVLACVTLLLSVAQGWSREARDSSGPGHPVYSRLITATKGKNAVGIELTPQTPYVRLVRTSQVPLQAPLAASAYVAMVALPVASAEAAPALAGSACGTCRTSTHACCSVINSTCCDAYCSPHSCWTISCMGFSGGASYCNTCGFGTCNGVCVC